MGDLTLIGLLNVTPKTHRLLIKRTGTTLLDHAACVLIFPVVKLAKGGALASCALDHVLRSLT